jgi:vacuolar-type H+-ATPase subunit F/Vma7
MIALGRAEEVRGFALAGVETALCATAQQADALLMTCGADATVGLVMVPPWVEQQAPAALARVRARRRAPVVLVLPEGQSDL